MSAQSPLQHYANCRRAGRILSLLACLAAIMQVLIWPSIDNIICTGVSLTVTLLSTAFCLSPEIFWRRPIPSLTVLCACYSLVGGALLAQTLSFHSLSANLQSPIATFIYSAIYIVSLLTGLWLSTRIEILSQFSKLLRQLAGKFGAFTIPSPNEAFILGLIGCVSLVATSTTLHTGEIQYGDIKTKLLDALGFLTYAPILILFNEIFRNCSIQQDSNSRQRLSLSTYIFFVIYFLALVLIGITRNSRSTFAVAIFILLSGYFVSSLTRLPKDRFIVLGKNAKIIIVIVAILLTPIFSAVADAMVLARSQRETVSTADLASITFSYLFNKRALSQYEQLQHVTAQKYEYSEYYIDNPFLARFIQTKFTDNMISLDGVISGTYANELRELSLEKFLVLLPTPLVHLISADFDKVDYEFSIGDFMYYLETNNGLGGYRVGSPVAHALGLFGLFGIVGAPIFLSVALSEIISALTITQGKYGYIISPILFLNFFAIYSLYCGDSLFDGLNLFLRIVPQDIMIYGLIMISLRLARSNIANSSPS